MQIVIDVGDLLSALVSVLTAIAVVVLLVVGGYRYWRKMRIWRTVLFNLPVAIILSDTRGKRFFVNPTAQRLLQEQDGYLSIIEATQNAAQGRTGTSNTVGQNGVIIQLHYWPSGSRQVAIMLTENEQLKHVAERSKLEEKHKGNLWKLHHELASPVAHMRSILRRIGGGNSNDGESLRVAQEQCDHLNKLILDLSEIVRPGGEREVTDLAETASEAVSEMAEKAQARNITLRVDCPSYLPLVSVRRSAWRGAFRNLIDNGIKYGHDGGKVVISMHKEPTSLLITVTDDGQGIDPRYLPVIWDMGTRDPRHQGIPGTGMGLAKVKATVESDGGTIECASALGKGTTFTITLPISE